MHTVIPRQGDCIDAAIARLVETNHPLLIKPAITVTPARCSPANKHEASRSITVLEIVAAPPATGDPHWPRLRILD